MPAPIPINDQILALHNAGVPTRRIEQVIGTLDHSTIARRLKHLTPRKTTQIYKDLRSDILAEAQRKLLAACDSGEINKMSPRDRFLAFGVLFDKERLERGLSTTNQAVQIGLTSHVQDMVQALANRVVVDNPVDNSGYQPINGIFDKNT